MLVMVMVMVNDIEDNSNLVRTTGRARCALVTQRSAGKVSQMGMRMMMLKIMMRMMMLMMRRRMKRGCSVSG